MNMFSRILITLLLLAGVPTAIAFDAVNPAPFTLKFDGPGEETIYHAAADDDGNLYIAGAYTSAANGRLTVYAQAAANPQVREQKSVFNMPASNGGTDLFVAKLDAQGNRLWVKTLGGTGRDAATGIAYDRISQRIFVAGYITGNSASLGTRVATSASGFDAASTTNLFIAALDASGNWAHHEAMPLVRSGTTQTLTQLALTTGDDRTTAPAHLQGYSLALAHDVTATTGAAVALYIKGEIANPAGQSGARLGINAGANYDVTSGGGRWAFVSKVFYRENPLGGEQRWTWEWLAPVAGAPAAASVSSITQLKVDPAQGLASPVYASGYWSGTFAARTAEGATSGFVAALQSGSGERNFVATVGGDSSVNALVVNGQGDLLIAGQVARVNQAQTDVVLSPADAQNGNSIALQPQWYSNPISSPRYKHNALVAKLSAAGDWQWATFTGGRYGTGLDLQQGRDGSYYLTGGLGSASTFNGLDPASPAHASLPTLELGTLSANNSITSISLPARLADFAVSSPSATTSREVFSQAWYDSSLSCPGGQTLSGNKCYSNCASPYYANGDFCQRDYTSYGTTGSAPSLVCPADYQLIGSSCYEPCYPGDSPWLWDNTRCWDGEFSYSRASEPASQQCPGGKQLVGGQCHDNCAAGYYRSGTSCVRDAHSYNRTVAATAACNNTTNNFCKLRLAYSNTQIQLLRNGTLFGSTAVDNKERGKANAASSTEIALTHYLDTLVNPNPKSLNAISINGNGNVLQASDQWQLRFVHNNAATDASYRLAGNWNVTFTLADGRTNTSTASFSSYDVSGSTGSRDFSLPFPTGYQEPELTPYSYAYVARFQDTGTAADFDWLRHSANRDTHGAVLVLNSLQTLYLFGGRGHQPRMAALVGTQAYATRDASGADDLASTGTVMNVIDPDSGSFLPAFLRYFDYVVGQRIDPPTGGSNAQVVGMLRRTVPAGMADLAAGGAGIPVNGELLSAPSNRALYAAAPLSHAIVLWPTIVSAGAQMQPLTGKAIRVRWPTPAEGLQDYIYSTSAEATLPALLMNPEGASKTFHWIQYAQTTAQEVHAGQTIAAGTKVSHGIRYEQNSGALETSNDRIATLVFFDGLDPTQSNPSIVAVRSHAWNDAAYHVGNVDVEIGTTLTAPAEATSASTGYVMTELARYDSTASVYARASRNGQIIAVNTNGSAGLPDDLVVAWYQAGAFGRDWPRLARSYAPRWPGNAGQITVASQLGSVGLDTGSNEQSRTGLHAAQNQPVLYVQNNRALPGFNPNEEHALLYQPSGSDHVTAFALRTDLNNQPAGTSTSDPYVLVRYRDPAAQLWNYRVFKVDVFAPPYNSFNLNSAIAGQPVTAPYPLNLPGMASTNTVGQGSAYWLDKNGQVWARSNGDDSISVDYAYRLQDGFWYDLNGDGVADSGVTDVAWKDDSGAQIRLNYDSAWPQIVPEIAIGDTLIDARNGLPGVRNMRDLTVVYDQNDPFEVSAPASADRATKASVRLFDYSAAIAVGMPTAITGAPFNGTALTLQGASPAVTLPARLQPESGHYYFPTLPSDLRYRLRFNPTLGGFGQFYFQGGDFHAENGRPAESGDPVMHMVNIMTEQERDLLRQLDNDDGLANGSDDRQTQWDDIVNALFNKTRNPAGIDLDDSGGADTALLVGMEEAASNTVRHRIVEGSAALSAAFARKPGYVVLAENVDTDPLNANPVNLHVIRVVEPKANGSVRVVRNADNALDPRLVVRQSMDFGGRADQMEFDWWWHADSNGEPTVEIDPVTGTPTGAQWRRLQQGTGFNALTLASGLPVLADGWVISRYRGLATDADSTGSQWSSFSGRSDVNPGEIRPVPTSGWVRRVMEGINAFEQRYAEFHDTEANSYISMLVQAGRRFEGDVALSTENGNLDQVGLIELYQTVLNSAIELSIDANNPVTNEAAVNKQLLLAASRLADFYLLLGNEAYSDAMDPTVGIQTTDGSTGYLAPTLFAFKDQVPNLLDEELALLRGIDQRREAPVYNRLPWNFSSGPDGEPTYVQVYGISDTGGDGALNDARILFPQAHGDAWGHYLTATKQYYALARHPRYDWQPLADTTSIAGIAVQVDYKDEERFARAAAAKARTGARIVDLTFRQQYTHAPSGQWQGYKDTNATRAWGMDEWARRAGQGAVLDWALGNALLPYEDTASPEGVARIDRQTVAELAALPAALTEIESAITRADSGANPFGLDSNAIPFDIDPTALAAGDTHFDQVYGRALKASTNALRLFDYANSLSQQIRVNQLDTAGLQRQIEAQEQDFKSRLIELMGYPYAGDIGSGKLYPTGYNGPDLYHYMYIDGPLNPLPASSLSSFTIDFSAKNGNFLFPGDAAPTFATYFNVSDLTTLPVEYPYNDKADHAFVAPSDWGSRRAPGRLQLQLGEMQLIQARLNTAYAEHKSLIGKIKNEIDLLEENHAIRGDQIDVLDSNGVRFGSANGIAVVAERTGEILEKSGQNIYNMFKSVAEAPPKVVGFATDVTSGVRFSIEMLGSVAQISMANIASAVVRGIGIPARIAADQINFENRISIYKAGYQVEIVKQLTVIESLMHDELVLRSHIVELQQEQANATGVYQQLLGEAARMMEERELFRRDIASRTLDKRYQDMTYRVFRNDALQKYRASFDLAARYTYLAAKAFDYETGLLSDDSADQSFFENLVRQRTLGYFAGGTTPVAGVEGLSTPLARMSTVFDSVKGTYGFYTPLNEEMAFSLRREALRIGFSPAGSSQAAWQEQLQSSRVDDLWRVPEFRRFCRPPRPESSGPIPGLVLRFSTLVDFGRNLFGWPLGPGDHAYDSSRAATKFRSVGLHFDGYPTDLLAASPRAYLVPVGTDVLRSPSQTGALRQYTVLDQSIPAPTDLVQGNTAYLTQDWIPANDDVTESWANLRRSSQLPVGISSVLDFDAVRTDTRLVGRSVWNTEWLLIIPGTGLLSDGNQGLDRLINGNPASAGSNGITDIRLYFDTYSTSGE